MPDLTVTDLDTDVSSTDDVNPKGLMISVLDIAEPILTGSWRLAQNEDGVTVVAPIEQQIAFRNLLADLFQAVTTLRVKFDAQVWAGHDDGSIPEAVESIRARRVDNGQKPGRKPTVKTVAEQLLKR